MNFEWLKRIFWVTDEAQEPTKTGRKYGWRPDVPDHRDLLFSIRLASSSLPKSVLPIGKSVPIDDQGDYSSCTGNASTAAISIVTGRMSLSRMMAYYDGRELEGTTDSDDGCTVRNVIRGLKKYGVSFELEWPYTKEDLFAAPTAEAYEAGKDIAAMIDRYERVTSLVQLKIAVAAGLPVVFGFAVPDYFEGDEVAESGFLRVPTKSDKMIGGHCVVAVGYDDTAAKPFVWVRNSWGSNWGLQGYFNMDQAWFTDRRRLCDDMWVIHPAKKS